MQRKTKFQNARIGKGNSGKCESKPAAVWQHLFTLLVEDVNRSSPQKKGGVEKLFNYEVKGIGEVKEENMPFYPFTQLRRPRGERCRPRLR